MNVWFSTPAFQRYELSAICFEQRKAAIEKLEKAGIEAHCIVVADDENLDIARSFDFDVFERDNEWLGRRFNDGYEYACKAGATHVCPIGSDSWIEPQFIIDAMNSGPRTVISSRHYTRINALGTVRRQIWVPVLQGVTYLLPVDILKPVGYRPCQDEIARGCDGSTWQGVNRTGGKGAKITVHWSEHSLFETTSFESWPQITAFDKLGGRWGRGDTTGDVFGDLRTVFGEEIVDKIEAFYAERRSQTVGSGLTHDEIEKRVRMISARVLSNKKTPTVIRQKAKPLIEEAARIALSER